MSGPRRVAVSDWQSDGMTGFSAEHDGYQRVFGLVHERGIAVRPDGGRVDGYDLLRPPSGRKPHAVAAQLRFHFHPGVRVSATQAFQHCSTNNIQVHGGMGFTWQMDCHLYYRRAQQLSLALGGQPDWEEKLVTRLAAANAPLAA